MFWIPAFKLGFWNAWILCLFILLHPFMMNLIDRFFGTGDIKTKMGEVPVEKGAPKTLPIPTLLLVLLFIYSIFLPLKLGTLWLYLVFLFYLLGIIIFLDAMLVAAKTPSGQIFSRGMYRYSRHPLYISFLLLFLGISLASASWLFLLLSMAWMVFPLSQVTKEEQGCLATFGNAYQEYMHRTPRWFGFPRSV